ncbi:hypothetical protein SLEP1_g39876 [Rubroshorea leprosula]|uniref:DNA-directed RNA polymerase III subunit RPC3 n=1 Tax=Rubroshorea leprosula TaxID=152421 RepID=A0AAV5L1Z4_9ROSI|nr:hypothetical protein SLEP1_g39876 [Rubroshorea leprosula]
MASQYGLKYAVHIITSHFGNLVAKVCECLLRKGPLTLHNLIRFTELTPLQVKNSLLVLIQHNCVQAFIEESGVGDGAKLNTQYIALFNNIIHRSRFSKFLAIVSKELGEECLKLFEGLLQHGRLTLAQIVDRAISSTKGSDIAPGAIRETFLKLLGSHFVERCPAPEPVLSPPNQELPSSAKRGSKSAKLQKIETETLEQRVSEEAAPSEAMRFLLTTDAESNVDGGKDENDSSSSLVGEKRKYDALELDKEGEATNERVILWRANFEEFIRRLRHKACIEHVRHLGNGAVIVLSAMLEATRSAENKVKIDASAPLSLNSIYEEVIKNDAGRNMTFDRVRSSLIELGCPPLVKAFNDSYIIDFKAIIDLAQNDEVESIVLKRYGQEAYKMFRALSQAGHLLETDKIAEQTFYEKKDTPKVLYKLWKEEYLHMEKLQITGARQSQLLLWKVNKKNLWEHVLDEMFHAALNLSLRLAHELEKEKELLNPPQSRDRIIRVRLVLESAQIKLDDAIMLFHDF